MPRCKRWMPAATDDATSDHLTVAAPTRFPQPGLAVGGVVFVARTLVFRRRGILPTALKITVVLFVLAQRVPGEGPDGHFPQEVEGFGPVPARIRGGYNFEFSL